MPRPSTEGIHLAGPGPVRRAPAAPCDGRAGVQSGGSGRPTGGRPLRWAGRGPWIRMISRRSLPAQRPPHAGISAFGWAVGLCTPAPQPLDQAATAPAVRAPPHAQADTDDDQLSARMPGAPPSKIAALSPIPRAVGASPPRRTTTGARLRPGSALVPRGTGAGPLSTVDTSSTSARPQGHRGRPPGSAPSRPRRPQDAAHAASQRPYPLSRPVV